MSIEEDSRAGILADCVLGDLPRWGWPCLNDFAETLLSTESPFPCTFAVAAAKKRTLRFGFVESLDDENTWEPMLGILDAYLDAYREISRDTSLAVFFPPEQRVRPLAEYHERFWAVLQFLHDRDPLPWPADLPRDPDDALWEFAYGDTAIFVVCNTPAHARRRSRHSPGFMITFQPRWVFEGLAADSARGSAARRVIRRRLRAYDSTAPSGHLGDYGDPRNREWRQYFLPDGTEGADTAADTDAIGRCPFHARQEEGPDGD